MPEPTDSTFWDPRLYLQFADQRLRPALELLRRVPLESPRLVVDLGCGVGNVTRLLARRWPSAQVLGVDHSREMLERAQAEPGRIVWHEADIADWTCAEPPDLIFSNAALHWLGDHDRLLPRLIDHLAADGCLAVQMPRSWALPSHRFMREVLAEVAAPDALQRKLAHDPVSSPARYHEFLAAAARDLDIWETEYLQVLAGEDPVLEWVRGAGLRPVLAALADAPRAAFLERYRDRLRAAYPANEAGHTLYPFRRLFLVATRGCPDTL